MSSKIIGGAYQNSYVMPNLRSGFYVAAGITKKIQLDEENVERVELYKDDNDKTFSFGKATAGAVLFGPVGAIAGLGGKQKNAPIYKIYWRDGRKSIVQADKTLVGHLIAMEQE